MPRPSLLQRVTSLVAPREVLEFWMNQVNPLWSLTQSRAKVVSREVVADGAVSIRLKPNGFFPGFRAGQHVNVQVEINGVRLTRSYSFANAPSRDGHLRLVVRATDGGKVSNYLQHVPVGTVVQLSAAFGEFEVPRDGERPIVMLAAGSGITPMLSLIEQVMSDGMPAPMHLVYWARTQQEMIDRDVLLAAQSEMFRVTLIETSRHGRISESQLAAILNGQPHVLACGPNEFVEKARELSSGVSASFWAESFTPAVADFWEDAEGLANVTLLRTGRTIQVPRNQSLLEALEANGLSPAHGCRMGICNTCSCTKAIGTVRNALDGKRDPEPNQSVRICVNSAQTDLTLDL